MTIARKYLINYATTCFYHCITRCVRQGFLLNSLEINEGHSNYRNEWIQRRLLFLSDVFAIDLLSFAIMDNHTHLVLFVNLELSQQWSNAEVLQRWSKIGKLSVLCQSYLQRDWGAKLNDVELTVVMNEIDEYRRKLTDISTFMSRFNCYVAKRANKEDKIKGHFWEARFKSQALLDVNAVLSCMQYVDLNPIRARKSKSLFDSHFTSIKYRLDKAVNCAQTQMIPLRKTCSCMVCRGCLNMSLQDYIDRLESLIADVSKHEDFAELDDNCKDGENWANRSLDFEKAFEMSAGESQLVDMFTKQARLLSGLREAQTSALCETILSRLRDYQYRSEKKNPYS